MSIRITVITICRNAADVIPQTIESVLAQDWSDIEYVIQDGASSDDTPKIIESYREKAESRNIGFIYNSEPDGGIYDAMNKAAVHATGDYINFMNAGDCFYSADVISKIAGVAENHSGQDMPSMIYGDCAVYEYGRFYRFAKSIEDIEEKMPFSHQSLFARSDFLREHPFNSEYRYSADYDLLLTAHDLNETFVDSDQIVCITTADGTSSINYHDTLMESARILKAHGKYHHSDEELARLEKSLKLKQFVLDRFPLFVKRFIRNRQIDSRGQNIEVDIPIWFKK